MTARPIGTIARGLVLAMIASAPDDDIRATRIRIAREEGILCEVEAREWLERLTKTVA